MSHFLQNLISRHQEEGVSREASRMVQPRPKAKYEVDTGPGFFAQNDLNNGSDFTTVARSDGDMGSYSSPIDQEIKPIMTVESKQSSRHTQVSAQHDIDKPSTQPDFSRHFDRLNEQIKSATRTLGRKSSLQEIPIKATESENYHQTEDLREFPEIPHQSNNRQLSPSDEVNHRIQKILQHLNSQQTQHTEDRRANESQRESVSDIDTNAVVSEINHRIQTILHRFNGQQPQHANDQSENKSPHVDVQSTKKLQRELVPDTDNNAEASVVSLPSITEPTADFVQPVIKVKKQSVESQSEQRESQQIGLLQTPSWLTEMQADLNNRSREINVKTEPEPVINVTIGRVEVKAVQTESAKQPKTRNKPSGVMGLDDYLKQREGRGTR